jgi:hypothetical protein
VLGCQTTDPAKESVGRGPAVAQSWKSSSPGPPSVKVPSAQPHFEAGLRAYYEARRRVRPFFGDATELDPGFVMCFWGGLSRPRRRRGAPDDPVKAAKPRRRSSGRCSTDHPPRRGHIEAMVLRVTVTGGRTPSRQRATRARCDATWDAGGPVTVTAVAKGVAAGPADTGDAHRRCVAC